MKKSETFTQFSCENTLEYLKNEYKRARGKILPYIWNRYQWNRYPRRKVPSFPLNIDIEVSSKCQLECDHCFRKYMDIKENDFMPMDMYRKIVEECGRHKLFTLKFSMRGEPLLHPDIVEMVRYAKKEGIKEVWINTNGGTLNERLAYDIIKAGVDWITVSFDGLGKMYESIRKPLRYEDSLNRLRTLRRVRDELKARTFLNVQTIWSAIKDDTDAYVKLMKGIVDRVAYNPDMNFEKALLVPDDSFICPRLWQRIAITSHGDYLKCPSDFMKEEVLGNIKDYSVKEAWDKLQEGQRQLQLAGRRRESVICNKCHHGAKKKKNPTSIEGDAREDFTYEYKRDFKGHGLNKEEKTANVKK